MRWLLFLVAVSASADCTSHVLYNTADYLTNAVIDDGALYVSLLQARDIEKIDLTTGARTIVSMTLPVAWDVQHGLLATPATVGKTDDDVKRILVRNGFVYWLGADKTLHRGTTETIAERVTDYAIFEDRVVYISDGMLWFKGITDSAPTLISPRDDLLSIGTITSDSILVTTADVFGLYEGSAEVLRLSWSGEVLSSLYKTTLNTYHNTLNLNAASAGGTTYIAQTFSYATTLFVSQNSFLRKRDDVIGPIWILDANENAITFAQWGEGTGMHQVMQLCAAAGRQRAVR